MVGVNPLGAGITVTEYVEDPPNDVTEMKERSSPARSIAEEYHIYAERPSKILTDRKILTA